MSGLSFQIPHEKKGKASTECRRRKPGSLPNNMLDTFMKKEFSQCVLAVPGIARKLFAFTNPKEYASSWVISIEKACMPINPHSTKVTNSQMIKGR